jgi:hypothetical protein
MHRSYQANENHRTTGNFLADFLDQRKTGALFERQEVIPATVCGRMSGNPVKIRNGCATVTATNSKATGNGKAE